MNKFARFAEMIDLQIVLFKGVRQSDNRFLKAKKTDPKDIIKPISELSESILLILNRLGFIDKEGSL